MKSFDKSIWMIVAERDTFWTMKQFWSILDFRSNSTKFKSRI